MCHPGSGAPASTVRWLKAKRQRNFAQTNRESRHTVHSSSHEKATGGMNNAQKAASRSRRATFCVRCNHDKDHRECSSEDTPPVEERVSFRLIQQKRSIDRKKRLLLTVFAGSTSAGTGTHEYATKINRGKRMCSTFLAIEASPSITPAFYCITKQYPPQR